MLAMHSGAPLLPVAHWGGERFLKYLICLKRTNFHTRLGEPFYLNPEGVRVSSEIHQQIADEIMFRLAELLPPEYRDEYEKVTESREIFTRAIKIAKVDLA
jgi:1-acyl-sn-glycerol-3-phosphate acyltransferase